MRVVWLIACLFLVTGCAAVVGATNVRADAVSRTTFHELDAAGDRRGFLLHRPAASHAAMPLLIALHGSSANANTVMDESGLNEIADSLGALVAYPNGTGGIPYIRLFWNFEDCCGPGHRRPDEAAMVRALIDTLARHFTLDRTRIGLIGFSDAGTLAYELACLQTGITAIGVISGEVPRSACRPDPAVSTVVFHGTADRNVPYGATDERVADWAAREGCRRTQVDSLATFRRTIHDECNDGAVVTLYTIFGGHHAWPGGKRSWFLAPAPSRDIDASRIFSQLVVSHPGPMS
jgi:polyhydroxybutyrate depolymerase